jgi:nucleoside-diphosphate-sugar epimerase
MRVVVTGATGNVGTSLLDALAAEEQVDQVVGVARRIPSWHPPKTTLVAADIRHDDLGPHLRGADALVHLAWAFQPTHQPLSTWATNVLGGIRTFESAAGAGVRTIVYASSVGAYSPGPGRTVDETWPTHSVPTAAYGREKAYLERYLDTFEVQHPDIRLVRMRPSFTFKRQSASEQRRIFAGSLLPVALILRGRLPVVPIPVGLRLQALHTTDAAEAYRAALVSDVRGALNIAADPVVDAAVLGELLGARPVAVPAAAARLALGAAWRLRLVPSDDALLDLALKLPTLATSKARSELGWSPRHTSVETLREFLDGLRAGAGMDTPPLAPRERR